MHVHRKAEIIAHFGQELILLWSDNANHTFRIRTSGTSMNIHSRFSQLLTFALCHPWSLSSSCWSKVVICLTPMLMQCRAVFIGVGHDHDHDDQVQWSSWSSWSTSLSSSSKVVIYLTPQLMQCRAVLIGVGSSPRGNHKVRPQLHHPHLYHRHRQHSRFMIRIITFVIILVVIFIKSTLLSIH